MDTFPGRANNELSIRRDTTTTPPFRPQMLRALRGVTRWLLEAIGLVKTAISELPWQELSSFCLTTSFMVSCPSDHRLREFSVLVPALSKWRTDADRADRPSRGEKHPIN